MSVTGYCEGQRLDGGIIAGGLGTRMGGADKGLLAWQESVFAQHIAQCLRPYVESLLINCNRNADEYARIADVTVNDGIETFEGPLQGLLALLSASTADWMLVCPCDTPRLPACFAERMLAIGMANPGHLVVVNDGQRVHPLHLLVPVALREDLRTYLAEGERRVMHWLRRHPVVECDFSDMQSCFENINSPELLAQLQKA